jgi:prepilin-type N-terminal cleavage/methylation domain-containing protein
MKRAFTLVELLVVVAIIAVLVALILPSLGAAKDRALTVRCLANIKGCHNGFSVYAAEWDSIVHAYTSVNGSSAPTYTGNTGGHQTMWPNWISAGHGLFDDSGYPIYIDYKATLCPKNVNLTTELKSDSTANGIAGSNSAYGLYRPQGSEVTSKGYSWATQVTVTNPASMSELVDFQKTSQIQNPAGIVMLADSATFGYNGGSSNPQTPNPGTFTNLAVFDCNSGNPGYWGRIQTLHGPTGTLANIVCYDGHGETLTAYDIRTKTSSQCNYFIDSSYFCFKYTNPPGVPSMTPTYQTYGTF